MGKRVRRKVKEERVDPAVEKLFTVLWGTLAEAVEEPVVLDYTPPVLTEKALGRLEEEMYAVLAEELYEEVSEELCDGGFTSTNYFVRYAVYGELPTYEDHERDFFELVGRCDESDSMEDFISCANETYDCTKLLVEFFEALPKLLRVKTVSVEPVPDVCVDGKLSVSREELLANTAWHIRLVYEEFYHSKPSREGEAWYGLKDGRVIWVKWGPIALGHCTEGFSEMVDRLSSRLTELKSRSDLQVYVYGQPPLEIPKPITVRRLDIP